ncbi:hypothetical protein B0H14DRAFT_2849784, partial [Mycena olivaceomarginata]
NATYIHTFILSVFLSGRMTDSGAVPRRSRPWAHLMLGRLLLMTRTLAVLRTPPSLNGTALSLNPPLSHPHLLT